MASCHARRGWLALVRYLKGRGLQSDGHRRTRVLRTAFRHWRQFTSRQQHKASLPVLPGVPRNCLSVRQPCNVYCWPTACLCVESLVVVPRVLTAVVIQMPQHTGRLTYIAGSQHADGAVLLGGPIPARLLPAVADVRARGAVQVERSRPAPNVGLRRGWVAFVRKHGNGRAMARSMQRQLSMTCCHVCGAVRRRRMLLKWRLGARLCRQWRQAHNTIRAAEERRLVSMGTRVSAVALCQSRGQNVTRRGT